jgi:hypothetical protein
VTAWADRDANGFDFAQGTEAAQPTWNASTDAANGHATISFDGDDYLARAAALFTATPATVFVVGMSTSNSARLATFSIGDDDVDTHYRILRWSGDASNDSIDLRSNVGGAFESVSTTTFYTANQFHIGMMREAALGDRSVTLDGGGVGSSIASRAMTGFDTTHIGATAQATPGQFLTGDIAEVVAYARDLSAADLAATLAYLAARYGITLA